MTKPVLTTTFHDCHEAGACANSYRKIARHLGGIKKHGRHTPTDLAIVVKVLGFRDAQWLLNQNASCVKGDTEKVHRQWARDAIKQVESYLPYVQRQKEYYIFRLAESHRHLGNAKACFQNYDYGKSLDHSSWALKHARMSLTRDRNALDSWNYSRNWLTLRLAGILERQPRKYVKIGDKL